LSPGVGPGLVSIRMVQPSLTLAAASASAPPIFFRSLPRQTQAAAKPARAIRIVMPRCVSAVMNMTFLPYLLLK
jgi:hypothetical protein